MKMPPKLPIILALIFFIAGECQGNQVYTSNVCEEDIEEALAVAYQKLSERKNLEVKLFREGKVIAQDQKIPDSSLNRARKSDPTVHRKEDVQLPLQFATERLYLRFSLKPEEIANDLPRRPLNGYQGRRASNECQRETNNPNCNPQLPYRTADGTCNNLNNPTWGSQFVCFQRLLQPCYVGESGFRESVRGGPLPEPRALSLNIHSHANRPTNYVSHLFMFFGQLLDHDITFTPISTTTNNAPIQCCPTSAEMHPQCAPILIGPRDPFYSRFGVRCLNFVRSAMCTSCTLGFRNQPNQVTAYIDASFVYGNSETETAPLRANNTGLLRVQFSNTAGELMPPSPDPNNDQCSFPQTNEICFEAGDARANQHPTLTSLHTVFHREHNRIARELSRYNPYWTDERIFQEARKIVGAEMQVLTYKEFLPITLGSERMSYFRLWLGSRGTTAYNPNLNPTMYHEFSTAAFRFGHSLINSIMARNWPNGDNQLLRDSFFEPFSLHRGQMDPLLRGVTGSSAQFFDRNVVPDVSNYLYRVRGNDTGLDLPSFNIQRGRDHGMPPYVPMVDFCSGGKIRVRNFDDLVSENLMTRDNANLLSRNYRDVNDIDLWTGILSEIYNDNAVVGPTATCIIGLQFQNLKFGDRFYFEHRNQAGSFTYQQIEELRKISLTKILCANTRISQLNVNAMLLTSRNNPVIPCDRVRGLDLSHWRS